MYPQGLAIAGEDMSSFVLFKDKPGHISFPIWCPVLPLGLASANGNYSLKNPYDFTYDLLEKLDFKITECLFDAIDSDEQQATLYLEKTATHIKSKAISDEAQLSFLESNLNPTEDLFRTVKSISMKAYEALALCSMKKDMKFSATDSFIQKTRDVAVFEKSNPSELLKKNSFLKSRQKYLM